MGNDPKLQSRGEGEVTEHGQEQTAAQFLPAVYDQLRRVAAYRLSQEKPGQTLEPTALVHEAWLRLVRQEDRKWADARQFFCAAAMAMRRILIDSARRKSRLKHGGLLQRVELNDEVLPNATKCEAILALDEALNRLALEEPQAAQLVEMRYFTGLGHQQAAELLGISRRAADGLWAYARAWLRAEIQPEPAGPSKR